MNQLETVPSRFDLPSARGRDYYTSQEVAGLSELSLRYVQRQAERGWCDAMQITPNGSWRFPKKSVIEVLTHGIAG